MAAVNADDAVAITAEFFASLDNVQAEAAFLLEEIRSRDNAIMEHLRKAESRGNSLYRSVRQTGKDTPQADRINGTILNPATPKDAQNHSRVMQEYSKVEVLQEEKMALADTLTRIVTRHRERSRDEWRKIVGDEAVAAWDAAQEEELAHAKEPGGQMTLAAIAHQVANMTPTGSVGQLIGQLVQKGGLASGLSTPSGMDDRISKKRKANHLPGTPASGGYFDVPLASSRAMASATVPSAMTGSPHPLSAAYTPQTVTYTHKEKKSRRHESETPEISFAEQVDIALPVAAVAGGDGMDPADADDTLYCFCQEKSHGQMIGCDNEACRFEWFHVKCMKLDPDKLPERWFCPECVKILGFSSSTGEKAATAGGEKAVYKKNNKGRKK